MNPIARPVPATPAFPTPAQRTDEEAIMLDVILVLTVVVFFAGAVAYVRACDRL
jgi:hypothetical protein